jgi:DNA-directed RNA polymerase subunit F
MSNIKIVSETPISMNDLKKELKSIKKKDEQLNYRSEKTEEYLNQLITLTDKDYKEIEKQLNDLNILRLKEKEVIKLLDIMPKNEEEVKLILSTSGITLKKEEAKKISDIMCSFF